MVEALRRSITLDDAESDCRIVDVELPRLREIARQPHTQSTPMGCCGRLRQVGQLGQLKLHEGLH